MYNWWLCLSVVKTLSRITITEEFNILHFTVLLYNVFFILAIQVLKMQIFYWTWKESVQNGLFFKFLFLPDKKFCGAEISYPTN